MSDAAQRIAAALMANQMPDQAQLTALPHPDLVQLRDQFNNNPQAQAMLAPAEHQAFAREFATESPFKAAVSLPFAIPAYTAAKYLGLPIAANSRSQPSMDEISAGYKGLGQGLVKAFNL